MRLTINAHKPRADKAVDHVLARVDVRPQIVTRHAVKALCQQDVLCRQLLRGIADARHGGLRNAKIAAQCADRSRLADAGLQSLKSCQCFIHKRVATRYRADWQPLNA